MRGVFGWGPNMISTLFVVKGEKFSLHEGIPFENGNLNSRKQ